MKIFSAVLFFTLLLLPRENVQAQGEPDNWYFGSLAGITFFGGGPTGLTNGQLLTTEGCSAISDAAGTLLFYTDGITVWNSQHQVMPNGTGLTGDPSSTESGLIVKQPNSSNLFYLFTVDADGGPDGFRYSIVDMNLQGGLGDITNVKNQLLLNNVTEKLCAVHAANGIDDWVMVHEWNSNNFYAYKLTSAGLIATPVISSVGTVHNNSQIQNTYGYMKFSPSGDKLALAIGYQDKDELFSFNDSTGVVSNPITLPVNEHVYGVEFSPNNALLYTTHYSTVTYTFSLDQYNLAAGTANDIINSRITIANAYDPDELRALQLGPDGKIYVARNGAGYLGQIHAPDSLGTACNYINNGVYLGGNVCLLGLPTFFASYFTEKSRPVANFYSGDTSICAGDCISFFDNSQNAPNSWQWTFDGANPGSSPIENPTNICYANAGDYDVTLLAANNIGTDTITLPGYVHVHALPAAPVITQFGSTLISSVGASYQWYYNSSAIAGATNQVYVAAQAGSYYVVITDVYGCSNASAALDYFPTGIENIDATNLSIFPNPTSGILNIAMREGEVIKVQLLNAIGSEMTLPGLNTVSSNLLQLNIHLLPDGIYLLKISSGENTMVKKIVKVS